MNRRLLTSISTAVARTFVVALGLVMVGTMMARDASAVSNLGPDRPGEFSNAHVTYYLSDTPSVDNATTMGIPIYSKTKPTGNVTVSVWCDARPGKISLTAPSSKMVCNYNSGSGNGSSVTIGSTDWVSDSESEYYTVMLRFQLGGKLSGWNEYNNRRAFRLSVASGFIIGYSSSLNTDRFAILNQYRCQQSPSAGDGCKDFSKYVLPFAAPCDLASGNARITIYDADNRTGGLGSEQYNNPFEVYVRDMDTGQNRTLAYSGSSLSTNGGTTYVNFFREKGHRYQLILDSVYTNNVIQFKLPFNSINSLTKCPPDQSWVITGSTTGPATIVTAGDSITWTHTLEKNGVGSASISYKVKRSLNGTAGPYSDVPGESGAKTPSASANGNFHSDPSTYSTQPSDVGKRICEYVEFSPKAYNDSNVGQSSPYCVLVGARPLVHILGNDARVGSGFGAGNVNSLIKTSVSSYSGSAVEYAAIAPSLITQFGSNSAGFNGNDPNGSLLSFANSANAPCGGGSGCFTTPASLGSLPNLTTIPNLGASLSSQTWDGLIVCNVGGASFNISSISSLQCQKQGGGTFTMIGASYDLDNFKGSVAIKTTGTVTMDHRVKYSQGALQKDSEIPQLIVYAGNIDVSPAVTGIDAWLVTTGKLDTCGGVGDASLRLGDACSEQLTINGPIIASRLALKRTTYKTSAPKEPAEQIHLRGDTYIWANRISQLNGSWKTTYVTELPPRY